MNIEYIDGGNLENLTTQELSEVCGGGIARDVAEGAVKGGITGGVGAAASGGSISAGVASGAAAGAVGGAMSSNSKGGSSGGGSSRVICTHFYKKGMLSKELWRADLEYTSKHLSAKTVRGYQFWAIPYVKLMRKSALAERLMFPIAKYRAIEIAYQTGIADKGSFRGKIIRLIVEPICFSIGVFVKDQDWQTLWRSA